MVLGDRVGYKVLKSLVQGVTKSDTRTNKVWYKVTGFGSRCDKDWYKVTIV